MNDSWLIWQLADAAFPAGGFAHSAGIEAAAKWGELCDARGLEAFVRDSLTQTAHAQIPLLLAARNGTARLAAIDTYCHAFINNHVANRASVAQGKAFLISAGSAFALPLCEQLREQIRSAKMHGHFVVVFGAVAAPLEIDAGQATRLFLYIALRGMIASGIRLNLVGPLEAQAMQYRLRTLAESLAAGCRCGKGVRHHLPERPEASFAQMVPDTLSTPAVTAPLIELFQATQDRLYSRLFQS